MNKFSGGVGSNGATGPAIYLVAQPQKATNDALPKKSIIIMASLQIAAAVIAFGTQVKYMLIAD